MVFGGIAPHDENGIRVLDVDPVVGHCAASERLCQSRNRGAVSDAGLVVHVKNPQAPQELMGKGAFLIVHLGCAQLKNGVDAVHLPALGVGADKVPVPGPP